MFYTAILTSKIEFYYSFTVHKSHKVTFMPALLSFNNSKTVVNCTVAQR